MRHRHDAHFAPFVGLRVASEFGEIVVCAYDKRINVEGNRVEKRTDHDAAAYGKDRFERSQLKSRARQPSAGEPKEARFDSGENDCLPYDCPCAKSCKREPNADNAGSDEADGVADCYFCHGHLLHQPVGLHDGSGVEDERQKHDSRQADKSLISKNVGNEGSAKP